MMEPQFTAAEREMPAASWAYACASRWPVGTYMPRAADALPQTAALVVANQWAGLLSSCRRGWKCPAGRPDLCSPCKDRIDTWPADRPPFRRFYRPAWA